MANEKIFMDEGGVKITNARAIVDGDTYSLSNITSCKSRYTEHVRTDKGKKLLKNLLLYGGIVLGIIISILAKSFIIGIIIALVGIIGSQFIKYKFPYKIYKVFFGSAAGEKEAISSKNEGYIGKIVNAVNDAIAYRG